MRTDEGGRTTIDVAEAVARNVAQWRAEQQMRQDDLAREMKDLGFDWTRSTVSDVELQRRKLALEELVGLVLILRRPMPLFFLPTRAWLGDDLFDRDQNVIAATNALALNATDLAALLFEGRLEHEIKNVRLRRRLERLRKEVANAQEMVTAASMQLGKASSSYAAKRAEFEAVIAELVGGDNNLEKLLTSSLFGVIQSDKDGLRVFYPRGAEGELERLEDGPALEEFKHQVIAAGYELMPTDIFARVRPSPDHSSR